MNKIKLIALDMDGTLLNDDGVVSDYTKKVLTKVLERGVHVVLTTGRPLALCHSIGVELGLPSYIIVSNGAEIWTMQEELLRRKTMDTQMVQRLWEVGKALELHMWTVATDEIYHDSTGPDDFNAHEWLKIGYGRLDKEQKQQLLDKTAGDIPNIEVTNSALTNIEMNAAGVNKADALRFICNKIGISMKQVIAMGDSLNDLKMIEECGIGIAMGNGQKLIKDIADYTTDTNNNNGVAKAIEKFVLNE